MKERKYNEWLVGCIDVGDGRRQVKRVLGNQPARSLWLIRRNKHIKNMVNKNVATWFANKINHKTISHLCYMLEF